MDKKIIEEVLKEIRDMPEEEFKKEMEKAKCHPLYETFKNINFDHVISIGEILATRRENILKQQIHCPECNNIQIQMVDWFKPSIVTFKCRCCKHIFEINDGFKIEE